MSFAGYCWLCVAVLELVSYVAGYASGTDASKHRLFFMLALVLTYLDQINERGR